MEKIVSKLNEMKIDAVQCEDVMACLNRLHAQTIVIQVNDFSVEGASDLVYNNDALKLLGDGIKKGSFVWLELRDLQKDIIDLV